MQQAKPGSRQTYNGAGVATLPQQLSNAAQDNEVRERERERAWQESQVKERTNFQQCGRKATELQFFIIYNKTCKHKYNTIQHWPNSALIFNQSLHCTFPKNRYKPHSKPNLEEGNEKRLSVRIKNSTATKKLQSDNECRLIIHRIEVSVSYKCSLAVCSVCKFRIRVPSSSSVSNG